MKVDLHVHASERSACGISSEEEQIKAAIAAGLDGIAFTDHHRLVGQSRLAKLNRKYFPFKIFTGIEIEAGGEDWLVLGVSDAALEKVHWEYPALAVFVRECRGFIILAHPFRFANTIRVDIDACPPDGIEVFSNNTPRQREGEIRTIAAHLRLALLSNSDAHSAQNIGKYYNIIPDSQDGDQGLLESLNFLRQAVV